MSSQQGRCPTGSSQSHTEHLFVQSKDPSALEATVLLEGRPHKLRCLWLVRQARQRKTISPADSFVFPRCMEMGVLGNRTLPGGKPVCEDSETCGGPPWGLAGESVEEAGPARWPLPCVPGPGRVPRSSKSRFVCKVPWFSPCSSNVQRVLPRQTEHPTIPAAPWTPPGTHFCPEPQRRTGLEEERSRTRSWKGGRQAAWLRRVWEEERWGSGGKDPRAAGGNFGLKEFCDVNFLYRTH